MLDIYYYNPFNPASRISFTYESPHMPHSLHLPWVDQNLWLAKSQLAQLFQLDTYHLARNVDLLLKNANEYLDTYTKHLQIKKWGRIYHLLFYRYDLAIMLGEFIKSPHLKAFQKWAETNCYND